MTALIALGSVWLDEIRKEEELPILDVPGGSVTFATLGARLFAADNPKSISLIFNAGKDFPESTIDVFRRWKIDLSAQRRDESAARGIVFYSKADGNRKGFQRLTSPLPVSYNDLTPSQKLETRSFHIFGTAEDIQEQFASSRGTQHKRNDSHRQLVVWEPHAKSCLPTKLDEHLKAANLVDVFSPNHEELASFFDQPKSVAFDPQLIEQQGRIFYDAMSQDQINRCVVVRAAGDGCLVLSKDGASWLPSFYESTADEVVDPTGAGNAFLGAFTIGWQETGSYVEAAKYGMTAASLTIEQVGLPELTDSGRDEKWNGCAVRNRLDTYRNTTLAIR